MVKRGKINSRLGPHLALENCMMIAPSFGSFNVDVYINRTLRSFRFLLHCLSFIYAHSTGVPVRFIHESWPCFSPAATAPRLSNYYTYSCKDKVYKASKESYVDKFLLPLVSKGCYCVESDTSLSTRISSLTWQIVALCLISGQRSNILKDGCKDKERNRCFSTKRAF
ncbi:hypothetical protein BDB00DRAFT_282438 [Zychaea mexicana]|uniref:uncharacterized protein n=1 Tax=Zychaea mexicana TaxID=64656 RepID=UPI0022FDB6B5|nr:uncharacterized protein BDB00DRAFT_282438 [Zychaea mexicana]KAI9494997.1 hypothetical protein BDB00DRAFT_282438 [Zychaea mexicana]